MTIFERLVPFADASLRRNLANQVTAEASPFYGGVRIPEDHIVEYHQSFPIVTKGLQLYMNPHSAFYKDAAVLPRIEAALGFAFRRLNSNGTKHYIDCDFFTPAGSEMQDLGETLLIMQNYADGELYEKFYERLLSLLEIMAGGMIQTGFQTPNHRWIFSGALALVYRLTNKQAYLDVIESYLKEGIDLNQDGDYAEHSAGIYNRVTNRGLLLIAEHLNRPEYYTFAEKNLAMMEHYIEPDGSIFTMKSTRQDNGCKIWAESYFSQFLLVGDHRKNKHFVDIAMHLYFCGMRRGWVPEDALTSMFMLYPGLQQMKEPESDCPIGKQSCVFLQDSGLVRVKNQNSSLSLLRDSATFFYGQFGSLDIYMRIYAHFFKVRNVIFNHMEEITGGFRMHFSAAGNFYLPMGESAGTSDWWKMDHSRRQIHEAVHLNIQFDMLPLGDGASFRIQTETCGGVPLRIEIGLSPNCLIKGDGFRCRAQAGMALMPTSGMLTAENETDAIVIGPVFGEHAKTNRREGAVPQSADHMTLYLNPYCSEKELEFSIRKIK